MKKKLLLLIIIVVYITTIAFIYYRKKNTRIVSPNIGKVYNDEWLYKQEDEEDGIASFGSFNSGATSMDSSAALFNSSSMSKNTLGYSTGGAKNVENFRENIKDGYFPISTDITYNGLFYDYSFDTGNAKGESDELFYPSYSTAISNDIISGEKEYYMSVGLNSNIKESDFARKKLNLVIVLDNSGSMGSSFNSYYYDGDYDYEKEYKTKMEIANNSVNILLDQLNQDDRFGMVVFNSEGYIAKYLNKLENTDIASLKSNISDITATGGTNFEDAYEKANDIFEELGDNNSEYENRIIVITDAMPNMGDTSSNSLVNMVEKNSKNGIYTSFIGVGVDFNTELIEKLGTITGANYYAVHDEKEFEKQMGEDFDFMVTPLVFDLNLDFGSDDYELEEVYGTDSKEKNKENIMHVNTLFPSRSNENGEVKGGIILLKLKKKNDSEDGKITLRVSYKDPNKDMHKNEQEVEFINSDEEYYDNTGIRKAIVLTRYANMIKNWILYERSEDDRFIINYKTGIMDIDYTEEQLYRILGEHERTSVKLSVGEEYKELFEKMRDYIKEEINELKDKTLEQEINILDQLI